MTKHLLYLHGFLSGPASEKAQQTVQYFENKHPDIRIHCPQLPFDFERLPDTLLELEQSLAESQQVGIIGSSLGGYLATYLSDQLNCPAVVINPAVKPDELLMDYLGVHQCYYSDRSVEVKAEHLPLLRSLRIPQAPSKVRAYLQTGDETLDYREAEIYYHPSQLVIEEGGDHSFQGYVDHLPAIHNYLFGERDG